MTNIGEQIYKLSLDERKKSNEEIQKHLKSLNALNSKLSKKIINQYKRMLSEFQTDENGNIINSSKNHSARVVGLNKIKKLIPVYKKKNIKLSNKLSKQIIKTKKDSFKKRDKITKEKSKQPDTRKELTRSRKNYVKDLEKTENKRQKFVYKIFLNAIVQQKHIDSIMPELLTKSGNIRIGSSFEQETESQLIIAAVKERTAYVMADAKENGYTYCWNANPLDPRTKPICADASLAGVIPEKEMLDVFGPPPRYICRCDLVYTRPQWVEMNKGINKGIEERREKIVDILKTDPSSFQKSSWLVSMGPGKRKRRVTPTDPKRAAGDLYYSDVEKMIEVYEGSPVPEYEFVEKKE